MRVLAITKIFPHAGAPLDAPHIRQQYRALSERCELTVLATIPWFPGARLLSRWSVAGRAASAPRSERIDGLDVRHPRFLFVPKGALALQGPLYAASIAREVLGRRGSVDLVLATWAHPDGVAAIMLARQLGVPAVVEVIGSDINVVAMRWGARVPLMLALPRAERVVAVSRQLADEVARLGVAREHIDVIPTGVNLELFRPRDRSAARVALSLPEREPLVLFLGRIEREKGVFELLEAIEGLAGVRVAFVGDGSRREELEVQARRLGDRALVVGPRPLADVPLWLAACNVMALPSWAEGTPNVILEALASGRRVVASSVGGIPDVVGSEALGALVPPRDAARLRAALAEVLAADSDPEEVRAQAPVFDWGENARRLHESFERALAAAARRRG
jgi:glycosyltransferase involved in cell wall biosynthesis